MDFNPFTSGNGHGSHDEHHGTNGSANGSAQAGGDTFGDLVTQLGSSEPSSPLNPSAVEFTPGSLKLKAEFSGSGDLKDLDPNAAEFVPGVFETEVPETNMLSHISSGLSSVTQTINSKLDATLAAATELTSEVDSANEQRIETSVHDAEGAFESGVVDMQSLSDNLTKGVGDAYTATAEGITTAYEDTTNELDQFHGSIEEQANKVIGKIEDFTNETGTCVESALKTAEHETKEAANELASSYNGAVTELDTVVEGGEQSLEAVVTSAQESVHYALEETGDDNAEPHQDPSMEITTGGDGSHGISAEHLNDNVSVPSKPVDSVLKAAEDGINSFADTAHSTFGAIAEFGTTSLQAAYDSATDVLSGITEGHNEVSEPKLEEELATVGLTSAAANLASNTRDLEESIHDDVPTLVDASIDNTDASIEDATEPANAKLEEANDFIGSAYDTVSEKVKAVTEMAIEGAQTVEDSVTETVSSAFSAVSEGLDCLQDTQNTESNPAGQTADETEMEAGTRVEPATKLGIEMESSTLSDSVEGDVATNDCLQSTDDGVKSLIDSAATEVDATIESTAINGTLCGTDMALDDEEDHTHQTLSEFAQNVTSASEQIIDKVSENLEDVSNSLARAVEEVDDDMDSTLQNADTFTSQELQSGAQEFEHNIDASPDKPEDNLEFVTDTVNDTKPPIDLSFETVGTEASATSHSLLEQTSAALESGDSQITDTFENMTEEVHPTVEGSLDSPKELVTEPQIFDEQPAEPDEEQPRDLDATPLEYEVEKDDSTSGLMQTSLSGTGNNFGQIPDVISGGMQSLVEGTMETMTSAFETASDAVRSGYETVTNTFTEPEIESSHEEYVDEPQSTAQYDLDNFSKVVTDSVESVSGSIVDDMDEQVQEINKDAKQVEGASENIETTLEERFNENAVNIPHAADSVVDTAESAMESVSDTLKNTYEAITDTIGNTYAAVSNAMLPEEDQHQSSSIITESSVKLDTEALELEINKAAEDINELIEHAAVNLKAEEQDIYDADERQQMDMVESIDPVISEEIHSEGSPQEYTEEANNDIHQTEHTEVNRGGMDIDTPIDSNIPKAIHTEDEIRKYTEEPVEDINETEHDNSTHEVKTSSSEVEQQAPDMVQEESEISEVVTGQRSSDETSNTYLAENQNDFSSDLDRDGSSKESDSNERFEQQVEVDVHDSLLNDDENVHQDDIEITPELAKTASDVVSPVVERAVAGLEAMNAQLESAADTLDDRQTEPQTNEDDEFETIDQSEVEAVRQEMDQEQDVPGEVDPIESNELLQASFHEDMQAFTQHGVSMLSPDQEQFEAMERALEEGGSSPLVPGGYVYHTPVHKPAEPLLAERAASHDGQDEMASDMPPSEPEDHVSEDLKPQVCPSSVESEVRSFSTDFQEDQDQVTSYTELLPSSPKEMESELNPEVSEIKQVTSPVEPDHQLPASPAMQVPEADESGSETANLDECNTPATPKQQDPAEFTLDINQTESIQESELSPAPLDNVPEPEIRTEQETPVSPVPTESELEVQKVEEVLDTATPSKITDIIPETDKMEADNVQDSYISQDVTTSEQVISSPADPEKAVTIAPSMPTEHMPVPIPQEPEAASPAEAELDSSVAEAEPSPESAGEVATIAAVAAASVLAGSAAVATDVAAKKTTKTDAKSDRKTPMTKKATKEPLKKTSATKSDASKPATKVSASTTGKPAAKTPTKPSPRPSTRPSTAPARSLAPKPAPTASKTTPSSSTSRPRPASATKTNVASPSKTSSVGASRTPSSTTTSRTTPLSTSRPASARTTPRTPGTASSATRVSPTKTQSSTAAAKPTSKPKTTPTTSRTTPTSRATPTTRTPLSTRSTSAAKTPTTPTKPDVKAPATKPTRPSTLSTRPATRVTSSTTTSRSATSSRPTGSSTTAASRTTSRTTTTTTANGAPRRPPTKVAKDTANSKISSMTSSRPSMGTTRTSVGFGTTVSNTVKKTGPGAASKTQTTRTTTTTRTKAVGSAKAAKKAAADITGSAVAPVEAGGEVEKFRSEDVSIELKRLDADTNGHLEEPIGNGGDHHEVAPV